MIKKRNWVLKIGGSLDTMNGQEPGAVLKALISVIEDGATNSKFVIAPGGGAFADFVRDESNRKNISDATAHVQATLAVSQFGYRLSELIENGAPAHDENEVERLWNKNKIPVFIPYPFIINDSSVPFSWRATSDTFAARICQRLGIKKLVLLKSVDGIFYGDKLLKEVFASSFPETDIVDRCFINFLDDDCEIDIINGRKPNRLKELLENGKTTGTRIYK